MAYLSVMGNTQYYNYDVEVYDNILIGKIVFKKDQMQDIKVKGYKEINNSFSSETTSGLVNKMVIYLKEFGYNVYKGQFLLNDVKDKRKDKNSDYMYEPNIFSKSSKQYDAQAMNKNKKVQPKKEVKKQEYEFKVEYKDKIYKTTIDLEQFNIGKGTKTLFDFNEKMLKDKIESFFKGHKLNIEAKLKMQEESQNVGKLLIDTIVYKDRVIGSIDVSNLNIGVDKIEAEGKDKQDLLNKLISQLKAHKLTGKLNWGTMQDKTKEQEIKKEAKNSMAKELNLAGVKSFFKNVQKVVKGVGMNAEEIDARLQAMVPNIQFSDPSLAGHNVDLAYILPWHLKGEDIVKGKLGKKLNAEAEQKVYLEDIEDVVLWLYVYDESPNEIRVTIDAYVTYDEEESVSFEILEVDLPIEENEDKLPTIIEKHLLDKGFQKDGDDMILNQEMFTITIGKVSSKHLQVVATLSNKIDNPVDRPIFYKHMENAKKQYNGKDFADGVDFTIDIDSNIMNGLVFELIAQNVEIRKEIDSNKVEPQVKVKDEVKVQDKDWKEVRAEFIQKIFNERKCRPINISMENFLKDTKMVCDFDLPQIKGIANAGVEIPNQKVIIASMMLEDSSIHNINNFIQKLTTLGFDAKVSNKIITIRRPKQKPNEIVDNLVKIIDAIVNASTVLGQKEDVQKETTYNRSNIGNTGASIEGKNGQFKITIPENAYLKKGIANIKGKYVSDFKGGIWSLFTNDNKVVLDVVKALEGDDIELPKIESEPIQPGEEVLPSKGNELNTEETEKRQKVIGAFLKKLAARKDVHVTDVVSKDITKIPRILIKSPNANEFSARFYNDNKQIRIEIIPQGNVFAQDYPNKVERMKQAIHTNFSYKAYIQSNVIVLEKDYKLGQVGVINDLVKLINFMKKYEDKVEEVQKEVKPQFKDMLIPQVGNFMGAKGKFVDNKFSYTEGNDAGLDVELVGLNVKVQIRLFPAASQENNRILELNQMKDSLRAIPDLPNNQMQMSKSVNDDIVNLSVSIKQFEKFAIKLIARIQGGLKTYYTLHIAKNGGAVLDIYGAKSFAKQYNDSLDGIQKIKMDLAKDKVVAQPKPQVQDLGKVEPQVPTNGVANVEEPANREVEISYKKSKVKDPDHVVQLDRMRAYIKKIAKEVDADNDFALRFLEEPKEFQKYKLPTVGVGLFYYGDKSIKELEQNALYKKVYRGRGLSILRKFFKTTDLNGEKCLLVLFVDNQWAKENKAKLIKEAYENQTTISISGKEYKVCALYENKFAIETIAGKMYIDYDSDLIDLI